MDFKTAQNIFDQITASSLDELRADLFTAAIKYARFRADWYSMPREERLQIDRSRSLAHNAFISTCDILSRNMHKNGEDNTWRGDLGEERGEIGDFACYLHCIIGLKSR